MPKIGHTIKKQTKVENQLGVATVLIFENKFSIKCSLYV